MKLDEAKIYSKEERVVGKWINGKVLYQKTIVTENGFISSAKDYSIPLEVDNVDFAFIYQFISINEIDGELQTYGYIPNNWIVNIHKGNIGMSIPNALSNPAMHHIEITVRYTKK